MKYREIDELKKIIPLFKERDAREEDAVHELEDRRSSETFIRQDAFNSGLNPDMEAEFWLNDARAKYEIKMSIVEQLDKEISDIAIRTSLSPEELHIISRGSRALDNSLMNKILEYLKEKMPDQKITKFDLKEITKVGDFFFDICDHLPIPMEVAETFNCKEDEADYVANHFPLENIPRIRKAIANIDYAHRGRFKGDER